MGIWSRSSTKYVMLYACRLSIRYVVRMPTVKKRPGRKRGEVTADDVVAAAIDIVDREGVDALTIRRVAQARREKLTDQPPPLRR